MGVMMRGWRCLLAGALASLVLGAASAATAAAQVGTDACTTDGEPNGTPEEAFAYAAPGCIVGSIPDGDQDLYLWTVTEADALLPWTIGIDGPARMLTSAQVIPITSDPGAPITVSSPLLSVDHGPDDIGPVFAQDVLLRAGRYVLGVARSMTDDGSVVDDPAYRVEVTAGTPSHHPSSGSRTMSRATPIRCRTCSRSVVTSRGRTTTTAGV
jgi:hypothetical protein